MMEMFNQLINSAVTSFRPTFKGVHFLIFNWKTFNKWFKLKCVLDRKLNCRRYFEENQIDFQFGGAKGSVGLSSKNKNTHKINKYIKRG